MIDWEDAITAAMAATRRVSVRALAYRRTYPTASRPALLLCSDRCDWIVKGSETGKTTTSEQVVCTLGRMLQAPIVPFGLVNVTPQLINATSGLQHMRPGLAHGTQLLPNCDDARFLNYLNDENRPRYAALHVLYSWTGGNDHQVLYKMGSPVLVYSHDHGHFFPGGPNWTTGSLSQPPAAHEHVFFAHVGLLKKEYEASLDLLGAIDEAAIVEAVVAPPEEWACTIPERAALAQYLWSRKDRVLDLFGGA